MNNLYSKLPNLVFGFHGCDMPTLEDVIFNNRPLKRSNNKYDWLGGGIYFWENSFSRADEWARNNPKFKNPVVIGAVIDLGLCLNLTDYGSSDILKKGYEILFRKCAITNTELPQNRMRNKAGDVLLRNLDCAVIQQIHEFRKDMELPPYDSVRGIFQEGAPIYEGSGFMEKTHVQLCIVNPNCIKGYFIPRPSDTDYPIP